jgi:hypothetical protein
MSSQDVRVSPHFSATLAEKKVPENYTEEQALLRYDPRVRVSKFLCNKNWCNNKLSEKNRRIIFLLFKMFDSPEHKLCIFISDNYELAHELDLSPLLKLSKLSEFSINGNYPHVINVAEWPEQLQSLQISKDFVDPIDLTNMYDIKVVCGSHIRSSPRRGYNGSPRRGYNGSPNFGSNGSPNFGSNGSPNFGSNGSPLRGSKGSPLRGSKGSPLRGSKGSPNFGYKGSPLRGSKGSPNFGYKGSPLRGSKGSSLSTRKNRRDSQDSLRLRGSLDSLSLTSHTTSPDLNYTLTSKKYVIPQLR